MIPQIDFARLGSYVVENFIIKGQSDADLVMVALKAIIQPLERFPLPEPLRGRVELIKTLVNDASLFNISGENLRIFRENVFSKAASVLHTFETDPSFHIPRVNAAKKQFKPVEIRLPHEFNSKVPLTISRTTSPSRGLSIIRSVSRGREVRIAAAEQARHFAEVASRPEVRSAAEAVANAERAKLIELGVDPESDGVKGLLRLYYEMAVRDAVNAVN